MDYTSGGEDIAPSVLGERYEYNIHLACGIVGWGSQNKGGYIDNQNLLLSEEDSDPDSEVKASFLKYK